MNRSQWFGDAPVWAQVGGAVILLLVAGELRTLMSRWRAHRRMEWVREPVRKDRPDPAQIDEDDLPLPDTWEYTEHTTDEEARLLEAHGVSYAPSLVGPDWARGRALCPCCGYPGGYVPTIGPGCAICDWEDPRAENPEWGVSRSHWMASLSAAKENYRLTQSALSPEEREAWAGHLVPEQLALRAEFRGACDYLRTGDRPDTSEVLERLDITEARLRELSDEPRWREVD